MPVLLLQLDVSVVGFSRHGLQESHFADENLMIAQTENQDNAAGAAADQEGSAAI